MGFPCSLYAGGTVYFHKKARGWQPGEKVSIAFFFFIMNMARQREAAFSAFQHRAVTYA